MTKVSPFQGLRSSRSRIATDKFYSHSEGDRAETGEMKGRFNIFTFTDLPSFLNAHVVGMKETHPRWSLGVWSRQLRTVSKASLVRILQGSRNPGKRLEQKFIQYFEFSSRESEYFSALVQVQKNQKNASVLEAIVSNLQQSAEEAPRGGFDARTQEVLTHWYYLPVVAMIHAGKFGRTAEDFSKALSNSVTTGQIKVALERLMKIGLVRQERNGRLNLSKDWQMLRPIQIYPQNKTVAEARLRFYEELFAQTLQTLREQPHDLTACQARAVCMKIENVGKAKKLIDQFSDKFSKLVSDSGGDCIYHLQLQFIPATTPKITKHTDKLDRSS